MYKRQQFMEKFAEIQKQFDTVFKELFGGGKGTLELVEDCLLYTSFLLVFFVSAEKVIIISQITGCIIGVNRIKW